MELRGIIRAPARFGQDDEEDIAGPGPYAGFRRSVPKKFRPVFHTQYVDYDPDLLPVEWNSRLDAPPVLTAEEKKEMDGVRKIMGIDPTVNRGSFEELQTQQRPISIPVRRTRNMMSASIVTEMLPPARRREVESPVPSSSRASSRALSIRSRSVALVEDVEIRSKRVVDVDAEIRTDDHPFDFLKDMGSDDEVVAGSEAQNAPAEASFDPNAHPAELLAEIQIPICLEIIANAYRTYQLDKVFLAFCITPEMMKPYLSTLETRTKQLYIERYLLYRMEDEENNALSLGIKDRKDKYHERYGKLPTDAERLAFEYQEAKDRFEKATDDAFSNRDGIRQDDQLSQSFSCQQSDLDKARAILTHLNLDPAFAGEHWLGLDESISIFLPSGHAISRTSRKNKPESENITVLKFHNRQTDFQALTEQQLDNDLHAYFKNLREAEENENNDTVMQNTMIPAESSGDIELDTLMENLINPEENEDDIVLETLWLDILRQGEENGDAEMALDREAVEQPQTETESDDNDNNSDLRSSSASVEIRRTLRLRLRSPRRGRPYIKLNLPPRPSPDSTMGPHDEHPSIVDEDPVIEGIDGFNDIVWEDWVVGDLAATTAAPQPEGEGPPTGYVAWLRETQDDEYRSALAHLCGALRGVQATRTPSPSELSDSEAKESAAWMSR